MNVLLSEPKAFRGGGTAFWPRDAHDAVLLRPRQGSALLFNGHVTHAGRAVAKGIRHTFVASFSLYQVEEEKEKRRAIQ